MSVRQIVVDRIEGDVAVVEVDGQTVDLPLRLLPDGAREGSVVQLSLVAAPSDDVRERLARMQSQSGISDDFSL